MSERITGTSRTVAWGKDEPSGMEFAQIRIEGRTLAAAGLAIGTAPFPYRLDYELETRADFVTSRLRVTSRGEDWRRELDLRRDESGAWSISSDSEGDLDLPCAGGDTTLLSAALDCDLGLSPVTNMMPILRHGLLRSGGPVEFTMAWVAVPALTVQPDGQRYRHLRSASGHHVVGYEATDGSFAAEITVDADAVVIAYPGIAQQVTAGGGCIA